MAVFFRVLGAIVAGLLTSFVLLIAVEFFSELVHPTPPGSPQTTEEICAHVANYPAWVLAIVVPMWGLTAFLGVRTAGWLGGRGSAIVVATLLAVALGGNIAMLPYPLWFKIIQPLAILIAIGLGIRWSNRPKTKVSSQEADVGRPCREIEKGDRGAN